MASSGAVTGGCTMSRTILFFVSLLLGSLVLLVGSYVLA
jgi:hypothetical protein